MRRRVLEAPPPQIGGPLLRLSIARTIACQAMEPVGGKVARALDMKGATEGRRKNINDKGTMGTS